MVLTPAINQRTYSVNYLAIYENESDSTLEGYVEKYNSASRFKRLLMALNPIVDFELRARAAEKILSARKSLDSKV